MKNLMKALTVVGGFVGVTNEAMSATPFSFIAEVTTLEVLAYGLVGFASAAHAALSAIVTSPVATEIMSYGVSLVTYTFMHFMF
jgi:hypothetical protein